MDPLHFFIFFLLMTAIGTLAVTGWYFITRGYEEVLPDGSIKKSGKIFNWWYFFWTKEKKPSEVIFYKGAQLRKLIVELSSNYPAFKFDITGAGTFKIIGREEDIFNLVEEIEEKWELKTYPCLGDKYEAYREYTRYVFPAFVRSPLAECATCFSSVYGSLFYWWAINLPKQDIFIWSSHPVWTSIFFWVAFCFSLSVLNTALAKRFN